MSNPSVGFDLVRWSPIMGVHAIRIAQQAYRTVGEAVRSERLGAFLDTDEGQEGNMIALGGNEDGCWLVDRWMSPLRPRKVPLKSLIASGAEVTRVLWTAEMEYLELGRWRAGKMVRTVRLGLDDDVSRGRVQPFETEFWDGTISPEPQFELVDKPREELVDERELIAREPPQHVTTDSDGNGRYLLTYDPRWVDREDGFDWPPDSFVRSDVEGHHVFLNLDTLHQQWRQVGEDPPMVDHEGLAAGAAREWLGLLWPATVWDWPAAIHPVTR